MPSKKIYVKPYEVKGHWRTIRTRNFKFICSFCDEKVERQSYATACPRYGNRCQGKKQNCLRNEKRTGVPSIAPLNSKADARLKTTSTEIATTVINSTQTSVSASSKEAPDRERLVKYVENLLEQNYNKRLTLEESFILIDLLDRKSISQISSLRKINQNALKGIVSNFMKMLSSALKEKVELDNFHSVMAKHYRAIKLISSQKL